MQIKKVKCPLCGKIYVSKDAIYAHITKQHKAELPIGTPPDKFYYDLTHNGKQSHCVICHQLTPWNPRTHKYHRLCGSPACNERNRKIFEERAMRKSGTTNYASDPEHQRKMLAGRSISGVYKWSSGGETSYVGSYERDFLKQCDLLLDITAEDIEGPSPHTYKYKYNGEDHFYIPDFYIPDMNLEIEVKDGGSNPNMHHKIQAVDKVKEREKDKVLLKQNKCHYIKVIDKQFGGFVNLFTRIRSGELSRSEEKNKIKVV